MSSIYSSIIKSKNETPIPVFNDGRTMESKYNPQVEAERIVQATEPSNFFLVLGIGSGILIKELADKYQKAFIIGVEKSKDDLDFLDELENIRNIKNNQNIIFTDISHLNTILLQNYIPSFYGNLKIIEQRAWIQKNIDIKTQLDEIIRLTLNQISRDFSVQAHFGKIWHKNILNNINLYSKIDYENYRLDFDKNKTAAIIAAGPSLDKNIKKLQTERGKYIIISTDTAYSSLLKNNIYADFVVSIDGQNISHSHFIQDKNVFSKSLFICDLSSDFSACNKIIQNGGKIFFSVSGHPLSELFYNINSDAFIKLYSGAGTVTISALDFAIKAGFSKIELFGADFAYLNGKSYTKGTYLDSIYSQESNKIKSTEKQFDRLLYRTELSKNKENNYTTPTLEAYRESMLEYLRINNVSFIYKDYIYYLENINEASHNLSRVNKITKIKINIKNIQKMQKTFYDLVEKHFNSQKHEITSIKDLNNLEIVLLPLISWLRFYDNKENNFAILLEKAYTFLKRN